MNREEFMRATGNKHPQHKLYEATNLINDNLEAATETFTGYLTVVSRCMQKTFKVSNESFTSPSWFDTECVDKKKATRRALRKYRKTSSSQDS